MEIEEKIQVLQGKDNKLGYEVLQELEELSESMDLSSYIEDFLKMLSNESSYVRVRGFRLICKNAKWDKENKIKESMDKILEELEDEKPIAVRQCLKAIQEIVIHKKELHSLIKEKISHINYLKYNDSMQELLFKDVTEVLELINSL